MTNKLVLEIFNFLLRFAISHLNWKLIRLCLIRIGNTKKRYDNNEIKIHTPFIDQRKRQKNKHHLSSHKNLHRMWLPLKRIPQHRHQLKIAQAVRSTPIHRYHHERRITQASNTWAHQHQIQMDRPHRMDPANRSTAPSAMEPIQSHRSSHRSEVKINQYKKLLRLEIAHQSNTIIKMLLVQRMEMWQLPAN